MTFFKVEEIFEVDENKCPQRVIIKKYNITWYDLKTVDGNLEKEELKLMKSVDKDFIPGWQINVLLSMCCRILPSRGLEIRTLRLVCENDTPKPSSNWKRDYKHQNIIYLLADGNIEIHLQAHKTAKIIWCRSSES